MFFTVNKEKRRPRVAYSSTEAFALPKGSNKQQETYADMTNCSARNSKARYKCHTHRHLLLTLILTLLAKVAKFLSIKHKASINAIQYVRKSTLKRRDISLRRRFSYLARKTRTISSLQNYYKFLIYANNLEKKCKI